MGSALFEGYPGAMSLGRSWMFIGLLALCQCQSEQRRAEKPLLAADGGGGSAPEAIDGGANTNMPERAGPAGPSIADAGASHDAGSALPTVDAGRSKDAGRNDASVATDAAVEHDAGQPNGL
ncbi:MAG TPA: hypothetical protein VGI70_20135, partial [Polyangiales bacterium]